MPCRKKVVFFCKLNQGDIMNFVPPHIPPHRTAPPYRPTTRPTVRPTVRPHNFHSTILPTIQPHRTFSHFFNFFQNKNSSPTVQPHKFRSTILTHNWTPPYLSTIFGIVERKLWGRTVGLENFVWKNWKNTLKSAYGLSGMAQKYKTAPIGAIIREIN